ncbi:UDP-N-acetyl-D-glucosamine dehydrogenase [Geomicrobium halophilum]|uniref:UDP-N-acetyl-D-glucosamine dehydrogenase n=1 Tax=Geomicrobium halophilum TaxID=549000 RepID=A0A841PX96_9BACL|nr:nucleotide sugar dehydrogenase [Geomicrobium halophilum]MBB6448585.1 UDP-N-acetyl-D-glucosamine dehydrogenase [Geomicrobium halophilum]
MDNNKRTPIYKPAKTKVGVIGLGYVGLPLALLFSQKDYQVTGIDINVSKINDLLTCSSYIPDVTNDEVETALSSGKITFTSDYDVIQTLDIIVISVPTPLKNDRTPDLRYLKSVSEELYPRLHKNQLVILESSTYPGTTREVIQPILEKSKLKVGKDLYLGYSPERIDPGNKTLNVEKIPKVVSGVTENCRLFISRFYHSIFEKIVSVSSVEVAEISKLLENSYRFINISFINEMAMLCDHLNINIWEVIASASSKPYGFQAFYPGPGIGGHCIPVDPLYLYWVGKEHDFHNQFLFLAEQTNDQISSYVVNQVKKQIEEMKSIKNANIILCGITYKEDSNDVRSSPPVQIMHQFLQMGANTMYYDPFVSNIMIDNHEYQSMSLSVELLEQADVVVILTNHSNLPIQKILNHAKLVYDTRNATSDMEGKAKVVKLGGGGDR